MTLDLQKGLGTRVIDFTFFLRMGRGNELLIYMLYHIVVSAKYHRVFLLGILISYNFVFYSILQLFYSSPLPVWEQEVLDSAGHKSQIQLLLCNPIYHGYGNPSSYAMSAAACTVFLTYEFKAPGFMLGYLWSIGVIISALSFGFNYTNQLLFGYLLGIWLACFIIYVVDFEKKIQRHIQKIIRGRSLNNQTSYLRWVVMSTLIMVIAFYLAYIISAIYYSNRPM